MEIIDQLDHVKQEALMNFSVLSMKQLNWKIDSVIISSPASNFITYYLSDVLRLIAQLQVRHLNQSMAVFHH